MTKLIKYQVEFTDANTGATSPIDIITAPADYTPDQYIADCDANGVDWGDGEIHLIPLED